MTKFNIYQNEKIITHVWADSADEALDKFAAIVSGYDTFAEMSGSLFFVKYVGVFAA